MQSTHCRHQTNGFIAVSENLKVIVYLFFGPKDIHFCCTLRM